jgi:Protein of unknown function (DUF3237)
MSDAEVVAIAVPRLELVARLDVRVGPPSEVARSDGGLRRLVPVVGGRVSGPGFAGEVLPGGSDVQLVRPDGVAEIDARYVLELDGGARVLVHDSGVRHAPADVAAAITRGEAVDSAAVYFRTRVRFETDAAEHAWLTRDLFVGSGARVAGGISLAVHRVG